MHLKKTILFLFCISYGILFTDAANIRIDKEASVTDVDTLNKSAILNFDISWENSWRTTTGAANYDGAWIFFKYRAIENGEWLPLQISASTNDYAVTDAHGVKPAFTPGSTDNKCLGLFAYRNNEGSGNINWDGIKIKIDFVKNGITALKNFEVKVFAIEMVYVPQSSFSLGSGGNEACAFYTFPSTTKPFIVNSENPVTIGQNEGQLFYAKHFYSEMYSGTIPTEFPKGYNAFWCMKYEIMQGQYVEFLNMLSRKQQCSRVIADISQTIVKNFFVMCNDKKAVSRNGIRCDSIISVTDPVKFYCDLNGNGIPGENNDGQYIACNFVGWADGAAYLDWAGLRPMTELEYEKACRGSLTPVADEFSWGSTKVTALTGLTNAGTISEMAMNPGANCNTDNSINVQGPVRAGMFFNKIGSKEQNGESFYGIADLSGNLFERCVTVSNASGMLFKGSAGDGLLDISGNATNSDWANIWGTGAGFRGGSYFYGSSYCRSSDRQYAGLGDHSRFYHYGFRGVRNAE